MFTVQAFGDAYERRARLAPAALVALPALCYLPLTALAPIAALLPLLGTAGVLVWATDLTRQRGRDLQDRLARNWGGLPTTQLLRRGGDPNTKEQRRRNRKALTRFARVELPSASEERADPADADRRFEGAVRAAFDRLRSDPTAQVLHAENRNYGFRRNLLALRTPGLVVAALAAAVDVVLLVIGITPVPLGVLLGVHLLLAASCAGLVHERTVREQADVLAEQLFVTLQAVQIPTRK